MTQGLKLSLLGAAAAIAFGSLVGTADASAITFTWSPSAVGVVGASNIVANDMGVLDFATANIAANGSFTEQGYLPITSFINPANNKSFQPSGYELYYSFNATGQLNGWNAGAPGANYNGTITGLSYSFLLDPTNDDIFNATAAGATATNTGDDKLLATGAGIGTVTLNGGVPGADVHATMTPDPSATGFFVSPAAAQYVDLLLEAAFTNTTNVAVLSGGPGGSTILAINAGGGNAALNPVPVPEPATLSIFGAALIGLGFASRRRRNS